MSDKKFDIYYKAKFKLIVNGRWLLLWTVRSFREGPIRQKLPQCSVEFRHLFSLLSNTDIINVPRSRNDKRSADFLYFIPIMVTDNIADNILITLFVLQECLCIDTTWSLHNGDMSIIAFSLFMMFQVHSPIFWRTLHNWLSRLQIRLPL